MNKEKLSAIINAKSFSIEYLGSDELLLKEVNNFKVNKFKAIYNLSFFEEEKHFNNALNYLIKITKYMVKLIMDYPLLEMSRDKIIISLNSDNIVDMFSFMPFILNENLITDEYLINFFDNILEVFKDEIKVYKGSCENYFKRKDDNLSVASRIYFHLVENKNNDNYPFAFLATYAKKDNESVLHTPLKEALTEYKSDTDKLVYLLSAVNKISDKSSLIKNLVDTGELFSPTYFTSKEAFSFFKEVEFYESKGVMCRIPKWQRAHKNSPKIKLDIKRKSGIGITEMLNLCPSIYIDDEIISLDDIKDMMNSSENLVKYRNKWINVNPDALKRIIEAMEKLKNNEENDMTLFELMKLEFNPNKELGLDKSVVLELNQSDWYKNFKKELTNPMSIKDVSTPKNLKATLRPYQQIGYNWLCKMTEFGLGACLADDMGLGKTLQIISLLTKLYETENLKTLLIVPSSLMYNWQKEFKKFSDIKAVIIHNNVGVKIKDFTLENKVYITSYKMAKNLKDYEFDFLIIDEAQAIKNVGTTQTEIVKSIKSKHKIALTGTPIENDLGDLYSLFDFLNKGLLGTQKEFSKKANKLIDENNFAELRRVVKPFILRRLKSDKNIISDLPDKCETITYINLTETQIKLYQSEIINIEKMLQSEEDIPKGFILSSIMKFKQICNHPSQFLSDGVYEKSESAKFDALKVIAENVLHNHEKMIVFTQFKELTEPLNNFLETIFNQKGFVIHGSTSVKKRDEMVTLFNSEEYVPFMILSLKAGGTGLNLVSANHVVHFDRWWNPAVENQATDRAFRIGQTKNVNVYKFLCVDTIEEKIEEILKNKQNLSENMLKSSDEAWISKLNKKDLLNLFKYGGK